MEREEVIEAVGKKVRKIITILLTEYNFVLKDESGINVSFSRKQHEMPFVGI